MDTDRTAKGPLESPINLQIRSYRGIDNGVAIAVVGSPVGASLGKSGITIDRPLLIDNAIGLQVVGSDGLRMKHALVISNAERVGDVGVTLDAGSNRNLISQSEWDDRSGTGTAYVDAGTGNCGSGNVGFPNSSRH